MKYAWIREHRDSFPVARMCEVLGRLDRVATTLRSIGRRARGPSVTSGFKAAVAQVHAESHGIYGSVKIALALRQQDDWSGRAATRWRRRCEN